MNDIPPLVEKFDDITERRNDIYCIDIDGTLMDFEGFDPKMIPLIRRLEELGILVSFLHQSHLFI